LRRQIREILDIMQKRLPSNSEFGRLDGIEIRPNPRFWGAMRNPIPSNVCFRVDGPNLFRITPLSPGIR
jgi:hypothetical protein